MFRRIAHKILGKWCKIAEKCEVRVLSGTLALDVLARGQRRTSPVELGILEPTLPRSSPRFRDTSENEAHERKV